MIEFVYKRLYVLIIILIMTLLYFLTSFEPDIHVEHAEKSMARHKVGVLMNGSRDDAGWNQAHFEGFEKAAKNLELDVQYKEKISAERAVEVTEQLIADGCKEIFFTSAEFTDNILPVAQKYPDVMFFVCSSFVTRENMSTYFGRIYQARYISGIMAGLATKTNHIAYIAAIPYCEVIRGVNAFTLGVRSVNPQAVVHLRWTNEWSAPAKEEQLFESLMQEYPIDLVSYHVNTDHLAYCADKKGIMSIGYNYNQTARHPDLMLTAVAWDWSQFYTSAIRDCIEGKYSLRDHLNGLAEKGVECTSQNEKLLNVMYTREINEAKRAIISGSKDVFNGPVYDQAGTLRLKAGESFGDDYLYNDMLWLVEGIEGSLGGMEHE